MGFYPLDAEANVSPSDANVMPSTAQPAPIRLIIGVDGTSCNPDGPHGKHFNNISNVYRICCSAKDGLTVDHFGRRFVQKKKYFPGIGSEENMCAFSRLATNISGKDCANQISEVYEYCCAQTASGNPENEIWFYGFSRGAYVVRAVTGLFHHLRSLKSAGSPAFKTDFACALRRYEDLRSKTAKGPGQLHEYLVEKTRPAPSLQFVGVFDTVKAVNDHSLYDISFNNSIQNFRQALALNEDRRDFSPEYAHPDPNEQTLQERSFVQAWFLGAHIDIGGSAARDGLSLYPFQWMLLQSKAKGLELHFDGTFGGRAPIDDPIMIVFPNDDFDGKGKDLWSCKIDNGIIVEIQDLRKVHGLPRYGKRYAVHLNRDRGLYWVRNARKLFSMNGELYGHSYCRPEGTILHPSVYMILDVFPHLLLDCDNLTYQDWENIYRWKSHVLIGQDDSEFWDDRQTLEIGQPAAIRILVCGNTGVGKSSLINAIFGAEVTTAVDRSKGDHNVKYALSNPNRPDLLIHDSGGFEAGGTTEVEDVEMFVKECSDQTEVRNRLHAIWFCVELSTTRTRQTSTIELFETISKFAQDVPIIVVAMKKDCFLNEQAGQKWRELQRSGRSFTDAEFSSAMDAYAETRLCERLALIRKELLSIEDGGLDDIIGVHKDDPDSLRALSDATKRCFDDEKVRLSFIAAQVISIDMKIEKAILDALQIYKKVVTRASLSDQETGILPALAATRSSMATEICSAVVASFGLPRVSANTVEHIINSKIWKGTAITSSSSTIAAANPFSKAFLSGLAAFDPCTVPAVVVNAIQTSTRLFLALVCDVILILVRAFKESADRFVGQPVQTDINKAAFWYRQVSKDVHAKLNAVISLRMCLTMFMHQSFRTGPIRQRLSEIVSELRTTTIAHGMHIAVPYTDSSLVAVDSRADEKETTALENSGR